MASGSLLSKAREFAPANPLTPTVPFAAVEQTLFETMAGQRIRILVPVVFIAPIVSTFTIGHAPTWLWLPWLLLVIVVQTTRFVTLRALAKASDRETGSRIGFWTVTTAVHGVLIAASSVFTPYMSDVDRAVHTMLMLGLTTGTVTICHGYRPLSPLRSTVPHAALAGLHFL